ncbi:MAG: amidohydrolase family protein, partial [Ignavibacteriales bacterium]|nr:amidohydrolase family protein [Ignavibacteriales bacterium]
MTTRWVVVIVPFFLISACAFAQTTPVAGMRDNTPAVHAFTNARIVVAPGRVIAKGTLVVRNRTVETVGENISIPADARVWNMEGLTLYPGFIDLSSEYGLPKAPEPAAGGGPFGQQQQPQQQERPKGAAHWNPRMKAEFDASEEFQFDEKAAEKLRSQGFALVLATPQRGIFRGQSALVNLGEGAASDLVVKRRVAQTVSFETGQGFGSPYPNSLMGLIAFIRQSWNDADWYRKAWDSYNRNSNQKRPEANNALTALADALQRRQPVVMDATNDLNFFRQAKIAKEFGLNMWIRGSGEEYRRLDAVKATKIPVIVTLNFPETPSVEVPEEALNVSLEDLRHWDAAPENAGRLEKAGVPIALSSAQLKDAGTFLAQVRKAVERGLKPEAALAALTTTPAKWLGVENQFGTLERGRTANFVVTDGDVFSEKTKIRELWIDGKPYEVKASPLADVRGTWDLNVSADPEQSGMLTLRGEMDKPTGEIRWRGKNLRLASVSYSAGRVAFTMATDSIGWQGTMTMSGTVSSTEVYGVGNRPDGASFSWHATRKEPPWAEPDTTKPKEVKMASFPEVSPPGEYGRLKPPDQPQLLFVRNATIWTQGKQGRLENADMIVRQGSITQIGKNLTAPTNAVVIDASGKHVTPGMIDCHSHTAAASINEGSQAITCETRIEDVLESDDIWIYRQLAGGTTAANILHGSANPIGGQNAVVKWRWGSLLDDLLIQGAPPGVKFALGENVKQSNVQRPTGRY